MARSRPAPDAAEVDRWARLPQWAKAERDALEGRMFAAERAANEARLATAPDESDALIDAYAPVPIGLGLGTRVRFLPGGPGTGDHRAWIDVRVDSWGFVEVMGGGPLVVAPHSSNVLRIDLEGRAANG